MANGRHIVGEFLYPFLKVIKMQPLCTVVIVTYRRRHHLKMAIKSVMDQTLTAYECLIFNDYPDDNKDIKILVDSLEDHRFRYISSNSSKGANYWRNKGIDLAQGKFIAFLDDDDQWMPTKLEEHWKAHHDHEAFLVYSDYIRVVPELGDKKSVKENAPLRTNVKKDIADGVFSISTTSSVSLVNKIDTKLFDEKLSSFQDWDAWFNLVLINPAAKIFHIKKPLIYYFAHNDQNKVTKDTKKRLHALFQLKKKYDALGIDISGFFHKQKLDIVLMQLAYGNLSKALLLIKLVGVLMGNPLFFRYAYTYRRIGRFLFKGGN